MSDGPDSRPTPLDDVRVVEISDRIAGSYCGKLLVDAGAEVRKIEPPQGDSLRRFSASGSPIPDGTDSPLFGYLTAGKRSLPWPATEPCSDERYQDELAGADIVVVTATRSQAARLGVDPQRLLADFKHVLQQSIRADRGFIGWMQNIKNSGTCPMNTTADASYQAGLQASRQANSAKSSFLGLWNPLASRFGQPRYTASQI